jgi:2-dehydro-3-deoxygluconokinase
MPAPVATFGEIMLRLAPPGFERLLQSPALLATPGGAEANVAVALSNLGAEAKFITALPANAVADAVVGELRRFGVDTSAIVRTAGRLGTYYVEAGANQRPSRVVYDRDFSALAIAPPDTFAWPELFAGAGWFHVSGITPAISASAAQHALDAATAARNLGIPISCDLNFRKNLWKWGKAAIDIMPLLAAQADVLIANEEDVQTTLGIASSANVQEGTLDPAHYRTLTEQVLAAYPNLKKIAVTLRASRSASHNGWSACLHNRRDFIVSRNYEITHIVDRVGGGDSFAGGLIYGLTRLADDPVALEFAVALSCLKHSIPADFCRVSLAEVETLLREGGSGRVQR